MNYSTLNGFALFCVLVCMCVHIIACGVCVWFGQLDTTATTQHLIALIKSSWKNISLNALSQVIHQTSASRLYKSFKHFSGSPAALCKSNMHRVCIDSNICGLLAKSTVKDLIGRRKERSKHSK